MVYLDEKERQTMLVQGEMTEDTLRFLSETSGNVADDGNYRFFIRPIIIYLSSSLLRCPLLILSSLSDAFTKECTLFSFSRINISRG